jgi:hypothetical protein
MKRIYLLAALIAAIGLTSSAQAQNVKSRAAQLGRADVDAVPHKIKPLHRARKLSAYEEKINAQHEAQNRPHALDGKASGGKIGACVRHAESVAHIEVPKFVGQLYDYLKGTSKAIIHNPAFNGFDDETKAEQADMLARQFANRHTALLESVKDREDFVEQIMDPQYCMAGRQGRMAKADARKDDLIKKYSGKQNISEQDEAYLLAEGVIHEKGVFHKTKDKLMDLKSCTVPNPANVDAWAWATPAIMSCRGDASHPAHKGGHVVPLHKRPNR